MSALRSTAKLLSSTKSARQCSALYIETAFVNKTPLGSESALNIKMQAFKTHLVSALAHISAIMWRGKGAGESKL